MKLHELIDMEDPKCLYCKSLCDIHIDGFGSMIATSYEVDLLVCRACSEMFEIHTKDHVKVYAFVFTCNEIVVFNSYSYNGFAIGGINYLWKQTPKTRVLTRNEFIPTFDIDFSDKIKLYNKLKTYQIFS
jgi:hypothetical protein